MTASAQRRWTMVAVYSAAHFLIDFACAFLMFRGVAGAADFFLYIALYNFCAFAMQMPLGILADRLNRNFWVAILGCALVGAAYGLLALPLAATALVGLGNALFHVGGGIDVLNVSEQKSGALGVFVSPGAFGVYFGTRLGRGGGMAALPILLALLLAAALIFAARRAQGGTYPQNAPFSLDGGAARGVPAAVLVLFLVVCLRSYVGLTLDFPWKGTWHWGAILVCAVVLGKTAGGFAADRLGARRTACLSLGLAALLFLLPQFPLAGVWSMLLFNMTMPITLWAMAKVFPGAKGFSFGLLTFGLFLGFLPVHFGGAVALHAPWMFALAALVSLALLMAGLRRADA